MDKWTACTVFWQCVYDYQNLISGVFAVLAAALGAWAILASAQRPVAAAKEHQDELNRRRLYAGSELMAEEFMRIAGLARQAHGTIKTAIAARKEISDATRTKTILPLPPMIDDWEFVSLLSPATFKMCSEVRAQIEAHNFDIRRAGGVFGDDNFQASVQLKVSKIAASAQGLGNAFRGEAQRAAKQRSI